MNVPRDPAFTEAVSTLANALQVAAPIAARMRDRFDAQAHDADKLQTALERATLAIRELQPKPSTPGGAK